MHICVIGDGTAGLMAANFFIKKDYVKKLTVIGSSKMPSIGVGESTTLSFEDLHRSFDNDIVSFVRESNAAVKTGVMYQNWGKCDYLHHFKNPNLYERYGINFIEYSNALGNKDKDVFIHDLLGSKLYSDAKNNQIPKDNIFYPTTWHFDAEKYIQYLKKIIQEKTSIIDDKVVECEFGKNGSICSITLESGNKIKSDYYIVATGNIEESSKIFGIEYNDLSNFLLTDTALFYPLEYKNKRKEFHPYTVAKTMKNGWRWITPTWSRIGTGYVFSSKHISTEEAIDEFKKDIGDKTIEPKVVKFEPRYSKKTFNSNYCILGMSNGFLEPLDAPGLAISCSLTTILDHKFNDFKYLNSIINHEYLELENQILNKYVENQYLGWTAFILSQYKTCIRSDTKFWKDHKNIEFGYLDKLMEDLNTTEMYGLYAYSNDPEIINKTSEADLKIMIQQTIASKNIQWKTHNEHIPFKLDDSGYESIDHYEYISSFHS